MALGGLSMAPGQVLPSMHRFMASFIRSVGVWKNAKKQTSACISRMKMLLELLQVQIHPRDLTICHCTIKIPLNPANKMWNKFIQSAPQCARTQWRTPSVCLGQGTCLAISAGSGVWGRDMLLWKFETKHSLCPLSVRHISLCGAFSYNLLETLCN